MPSWPLSDDERFGLERLGELLAQHGAARFLVAPLVRADRHDFPDPWTPTLDHLRALLGRMFWLVQMECELEVELSEAFRLERETWLELVEASPGHARFVVGSLGLDDVPGAASHEVGRAILAMSAMDPFRQVPELPSTTDGSNGAVLAGLGVLAANVACYVEKGQVVQRGGLSNDAFGLLLAAQDRVRDIPQPEALATLRDSARDAYREWRDILEPHRDELRALMHLDSLELER